MIGLSHAKINLGLFVMNKRSDGFHDLESVFWPVDWTDVLEVHTKATPGLELKATGLKIPGGLDDNLIARAYTLLAERRSIGGASAHLHKVIPMGAGLGGGSSNATCMIRLLDRLFALNLTDSEGLELAAELGSDCPFFWSASPALVSGRGDGLSAIPQFEADNWKNTYLTVIYPGAHVSTSEAFHGCTPKSRTLDWSKLSSDSPDKWHHWLQNDFEENSSAQHPTIHQALVVLENSGADYVQMTGTGSAAFGVFRDEAAAANARNSAIECNWLARTCPMDTCL
tara:strand:- start:3660 stop:4511 length:852 start_codon:yes stop_codon:yes gene_type:complete